MARLGYTRSTDATEVLPNAWLFGHLYSKYRRSPVWWALVLLFVNFALLPLEVLLEGGIEESPRCAPYKDVSTGVCASPYAGHSESGISAAMLMTQRFTWVDEKWDYVLVGSSKIPRANEVRVNEKLLNSNRSYVVRDCVVKTSPCPHNQPCGELIVTKTNGPYDTMVDNPNAPKGKTGRGDITYDKSLGVAFHFWEVSTSATLHKSLYSRKTINVAGIETILNQQQVDRVLDRNVTDNWTFPVNNSVTRLYELSCVTDGLLAKDLARAVSLFRTTQMEQPGVRRSDVGDNLTKFSPLTASNVAMAAYALKAEDWSDPCSGEIDLYTTCGTFKASFVLPFLCLSFVIVAAWLIVTGVIRETGNAVPVDTVTWRKHALRAIRSQSGSTRSLGLDDRTVSSEDVFATVQCTPAGTLTGSLEESRRRQAAELAAIQGDIPRRNMPAPNMLGTPGPIGLGANRQPVEYSNIRYSP